MATEQRLTLQQYLDLEYTCTVISEHSERELGEYVIESLGHYGCATQIEDIAEAGSVADEIRQLWIETAYDHGFDIPLPSYPEQYSGKFNVRLHRSLHRKLAESARREDLSLNQHIVAHLSEEVTIAGISNRLADLEAKLDGRIDSLEPTPAHVS